MVDGEITPLRDGVPCASARVVRSSTRAWRVPLLAFATSERPFLAGSCR
jgi:hypothetical protein